MAQPGMFGSLFRPREDVSDLDYARLTPAEQRAFDTRGYQRMAEQGVSQAGRGLLGMPVEQTTDRTAVVEELRALAKTARPGTKDFYTAATALFTKHGMVEEATKMQEQLAALTEKERAVTLETRKADAPTTEVEKLQAARNRALAAGNTAAAEELTKRIDALVREKVGSQQADPELVKLQAAQARALAAGDTVSAEQIKARITNLIAGKSTEMSPAEKAAEVHRQAQRDRWDRADKLKEAEAAAEKGKLDEKARTSIDRSAEQAARVVHFATRALKHSSGLTAGLLGKAQSYAPGTPGYNLAQDLQSIAANVSFKELQAMRAASPTGGALGQVSDFENRLLQSVEGSLDIGQTPARLRANLARILENANALLAAIKAAGGKVPVVPKDESTSATPATGAWKARELK